jgi:hypothetical protein
MDEAIFGVVFFGVFAVGILNSIFGKKRPSRRSSLFTEVDTSCGYVDPDVYGPSSLNGTTASSLIYDAAHSDGGICTSTTYDGISTSTTDIQIF